VTTPATAAAGGYPPQVTAELRAQCANAAASASAPNRLCATLVACVESKLSYAKFKQIAPSTTGRAAESLGERYGKVCAVPALAAINRGGGPAVIAATGTADELAAARVAVRYLNAMISGDYAGACATRTAGDRQQLAKVAGTCEAGFRAVEASGRLAAVKALFAGAKVTGFARRGNLIGVRVLTVAGKTLKLAALKTAGGWRLEDIPNAKIP